MVERSLKIDNSADAKVQAASSLVSANRIPRALQLIDQAMKQGRMTDAQRVFALLTRSPQENPKVIAAIDQRYVAYYGDEGQRYAA